VCFRSRDGLVWQDGGAPPSFSGQPVDVFGWGGIAAMLTDDGADCKVWFSSDAALTWTGPWSLPNGGGNPNYDRVAWITSANMYVAAGANCLATSPDFTTWTARTASSYGVACIAVPGEGESGIGALIPRSTSNEISYTLNGTTWVHVPLGANGTTLVAACWSEVHSAWFALNDNGQLFRAATVDGSWSQVAALYGPTTSSFTRKGVTMAAWGKNLVILGEKIRVTGTVLERSGQILVYDPVNGYGSAFSPNAGYLSGRAFDRLVKHDGRLVAARTADESSPFHVYLAMSLRAPWEAA
jgi:hypothetical protein